VNEIIEVNWTAASNWPSIEYSLLLELAVKAAEKQKNMTDEEIEEWARRLAADVWDAGD